MKRKIDLKLYILDTNGKLLKRKCYRCGKFKMPSNFGLLSTNIFKIRSDCKPCRKIERTKAYYKKYRVVEKENRRKLRKEVINHYGGKCTCCGETTYEFLAIDHINGDGNEQRRKIGIMRVNKNKGIKTRQMSYSSGQFIHWVIKNGFPKDLQVLCHNCNSAKTYHGFCPHKKVEVPNFDVIPEEEK